MSATTAPARESANRADHDRADAEWLAATLARFTSDDRRRAGAMLRVLASAP